jgi:hypothetical protein
MGKLVGFAREYRFAFIARLRLMPVFGKFLSIPPA